MIKILSIDGGGIRGILPAIFLAEIENRTNKKIVELFDLIAGTSTGGILALGLTKPDITFKGKPKYSAQELVNLYEKEGTKIFRPDLLEGLWTDAGRTLHPKYPFEGLEKVLGTYFGDTRLSESLKDVLITSYDLERRRPQIFRLSWIHGDNFGLRFAKPLRDKHFRNISIKILYHIRTFSTLDPGEPIFLSSQAKKKVSEDFPMKLVARATSAAPTYFEPLKLNKPSSSDYYALVDGGVYANNPAMYAYIEAKRVYKDVNDCLLVSLGTGELSERIPYEKARTWGLASWSQPILDVVFDGIGDAVNYQLQQLIPDDKLLSS